MFGRGFFFGLVALPLNYEQLAVDQAGPSS